jgi:hypothetical protein
MMALPGRTKVTFLIILLILCASCSKSSQTKMTPDSLEAPPIAGENAAPTLALKDSSAQASNLIPSGVLVYPLNGEVLKFYDSTGKFIADINTPGIGDPDPQTVTTAGKVSANNDIPPVVFLHWNTETALQVNSSNSIWTLRNTNSFLALTGAPNQDALAFSELVIENNTLHSYLYAGKMNNLGNVNSFYDWSDETTNSIIMPVAVEAANGKIQGVWFTKTAWGIGGANIIFPMNSGLSLIKPNTNEIQQYLDTQRNFQGISPDHQIAGSTAMDFNGDHSMTINKFSSNQTIHFQLKPTSDRGAGFVVFAPDNQYAAWLEARGYFSSDPPDFQATVRIGDILSKTTPREISASSIMQILDGVDVVFIKPVGWLDDQSLLIEAWSQDWQQVFLIRANITDGHLSQFSKGKFIGFVY